MRNKQLFIRFLLIAIVMSMLVGCSSDTIVAVVPVTSEEEGIPEISEDHIPEDPEIEKVILSTPTVVGPEVEVNLGWEWEEMDVYMGQFTHQGTFDGEKSIEVQKARYDPLGKNFYFLFTKYLIQTMSLDYSYSSEKDEWDFLEYVQSVLPPEVVPSDLINEIVQYKNAQEEGFDMSIFITENGQCFYPKDGCFTLIHKDGTAESYPDENIPWNKIPKEYWALIIGGDTVFNLQTGEGRCNVMNEGW